MAPIVATIAVAEVETTLAVEDISDRLLIQKNTVKYVKNGVILLKSVLSNAIIARNVAISLTIAIRANG